MDSLFSIFSQLFEFRNEIDIKLLCIISMFIKVSGLKTWYNELGLGYLGLIKC